MRTQKEPHCTPLAPGEAMGYYRPKHGGAVTWSARLYDPTSKMNLRTTLGTADDYTDADSRNRPCWWVTRWMSGFGVYRNGSKKRH